ncbi:hydroxymyristoyl-ACP dehydratase [Chryseolinea sp. H1M3-3]|uniref:hydroxymyristoyl-ACP dehydratase n=1 Tax=Chryseolinea sp. H1M3-3 TaxID=3034144 RepID=UPI0023EBB967|nr:hydroxymyristoyl-ACP dehydratase [Chryseolinea sp. H1M3-3]
MILLNDFYTILQRDTTPGTVKAKIAINKKHRILEGHFPGLPVVPGVCMLQMVREVMEVNTGKELNLKEADNMKFLSVINPEQHNEVDVSIHYTEDGGKFSINATLFAGTVTFFKLKAMLQTA